MGNGTNWPTTSKRKSARGTYSQVDAGRKSRSNSARMATHIDSAAANKMTISSLQASTAPKLAGANASNSPSKINVSESQGPPDMNSAFGSRRAFFFFLAISRHFRPAADAAHNLPERPMYFVYEAAAFNRGITQGAEIATVLSRDKAC